VGIVGGFVRLVGSAGATGVVYFGSTGVDILKSIQEHMSMHIHWERDVFSLFPRGRTAHQHTNNALESPSSCIFLFFGGGVDENQMPPDALMEDSNRKAPCSFFNKEPSPTRFQEAYYLLYSSVFFFFKAEGRGDLVWILRDRCIRS